MQTTELAKIYDPSKVEEKWYENWEKSNYFQAAANEETIIDNKERRTFSIVMPPPNVTGSLHLGHALDNTLQDILTRWKRMQGYKTLWVPGTDHAGIATQAKVEEQLAQEGLSKYDMGREKFLQRVWDWKNQYGSKITRQLRKLGTSCDWSRERFTMDEGCSRAVREVFVRLYTKGLIYRGDYIINWCPKCQTTISDIEVEHESRQGNLWYIRYPIIGSERVLTVATTRPETMLGDTAVAVHPADERYNDLIGHMVELPLTGRQIPVIADETVDREFGTGAVKITPAHDPNDFEMGLRHKLPQITVMDKNAVMNEEAGVYRGLDRYEARKKIVADLERLGLLEKTAEHEHAVGQCYRCDTVIEPRVSKQWFVRMQPLADPAMKAVIDGRIKIVPERFTKIYLNWLENIRDWCISRQLWWGHRIPVWYCKDCDEIICTKDDPEACPKCGSRSLVQDPDVLDTWFSSGLWPFSTLGWPDDTTELRSYYPTSVMVTGRDIIFFWVARMIFMGLEFMPEVPFREVFIHGLVLDAQGRKMSKSLGNGIDPIELINEYGADTLRFTLITGNTPGNDLRFQTERLESTRNFSNKIWNASRFALMNLQDYDDGHVPEHMELADRWIRSRFNRTAAEVTRNMERYDFGEAARVLYEFLWDDLCDWYIELIKPRLYGREGEDSRRTAQHILASTLSQTLKLLHPFMPFITEEIWQMLSKDKVSIMLSSWCSGDAEELDEEAEAQLSASMDVIKSIRNLRSELNIAPGKRAAVRIIPQSREAQEAFELSKNYILNLAFLSEFDILPIDAAKPDQAVAAIASKAEVYLLLRGLIDVEKELSRLNKELENYAKEIARIEAKLNNQGFINKAPQEVIIKEKEKMADFKAKQDSLNTRIKSLQ